MEVKSTKGKSQSLGHPLEAGCKIVHNSALLVNQSLRLKLNRKIGYFYFFVLLITKITK